MIKSTSLLLVVSLLLLKLPKILGAAVRINKKVRFMDANSTAYVSQVIDFDRTIRYQTCH